jgi:hypothetical protein
MEPTAYSHTEILRNAQYISLRDMALRGYDERRRTTGTDDDDDDDAGP